MRKRNFKEWLKGKGFYISLMVGAICVVAIAAVCLDSFGVNKSISDEEDRNNIAKLDSKDDDYDIMDSDDVEKNANEFYERMNSEETVTEPPVQAEVTDVPDENMDVASVEEQEENNKKTNKSSKKNNKKAARITVKQMIRIMTAPIKR